MRLRSLALVGSLAVIPVLAGAFVACGGGDVHPGGAVSGEGGFPAVDSGVVPDGSDPDAGIPANIAHASTICGTIACGIMGIKKSGFQELADVSFLVKDSGGQPVGGAQVQFELESPPTGTEFLNGTMGTPTVTIKTDAKGIATVRVQSGVTLGVFTVKASVSPTIQAKSPAIGVRGVTPANRGFSIQCGLKNLAAYVDPLPPKPLKTSCVITLIDRFNNPVGKGTTVNLKVEAGAIPSSVQSTAFNAMGANTDEGKAIVDFSTVGTFPALDVPALPGELSAVSGTTTLNPRDGLVTILAYVAGEEAFDDNNSNGKWDAGENFIDQGEPFVDANDNNQWDAGEFYADVAPSNGKYDPPNGVWDKQTTIWTTTYVLYTGTMTRSIIVDPAVTVALSPNTKVVKAYFADARFNPPQSSPATSFAFGKSGGSGRGTGAAVFETILDGYGFDLTRALYDADNPSVGCNAGLARCVWLTKFDFTPSPYVLGTTATLTGAAAAVANDPPQTLTWSVTVQGTKVDHTSTATFD